jgi:hypothetical protein
MERKKVPRTIDATDTYVIDPEDVWPQPVAPQPTRPCGPAAELPPHWGQWLRPA